MRNRFRVIKGDGKPKAGHSNKKGAEEMFLCRCGHSVFNEQRFGIFVKNGRLSRGQRRLVCASCGIECWLGR